MCSWASLGARSLNLACIIPLTLKYFTTEETSFWYSLMTLQGMQFLALMGFSPTFSRFAAYAMKGAKLEDLQKHNNEPRARSDEPNAHLAANLVKTMSTVHVLLAIVWLLLSFLVGVLLIPKWSVSTNAETHFELWLAWSIYSITSSYKCYGWLYSSYLIGTGNVASVRRCETLGWAISALFQILVLLGRGRVLSLTIVFQASQIGMVLAMRYLAWHRSRFPISRLPPPEFSSRLLSVVWGQSWRSAFGQVISVGLTQATGLFYASVGEVRHAASYLVALTLIRQLSIFSQAPFYSHIPTLTALRAQRETEKLVTVAKSQMRLSHWTLVIGLVALGVLGPRLFTFLECDTPFVPPLLWFSLAAGLFLERMSGMHMQLYTTTNHVVWHIVNGITGAVTLVAMVCLFPALDVHAFPVALIIGQLAFSVWYCAGLSCRSVSVRPLAFELTVGLPAGVVLLAWGLAYCFVG